MDMLYAITIFPLELLYKAVLIGLHSLVNSWGWALALLSLLSFFFMKPFESYVSKFQKYEKNLQNVLLPQLTKIKNESQGAERHKRITNLYKRYSYHPIFSLRASLGLLVQVPFLMAAYFMLSTLPQIQGQSLGFIHDLAKPDALLGGINLLPFVMTFVNCLSVYFYPSDGGQKAKMQLYGMAIFFLLILYAAPSALIFYWTFNNFWGLIKNVLTRKAFFVKIIQHIYDLLQHKLCWIFFLKKAVSKIYFPFVVALLPSVIVFVSGGVGLYINNIDEFEFRFPFSMLLEILIVFSVNLTFVIFLLLLLISFNTIIYRRFVAFIVGICIALFIEGNILSFNFSVLDGTTQLDILSVDQFISATVWFFSIFLLQLLYAKVTFRYVVFLVLFSLIYPLISMSENQDKIYSSENLDSYNELVVDEDFFNFSKKSNTILITLDSLNGHYIEKIFKETPEYKEIFDGFYWMKDFSAKAIATKGAAPQIYGAPAYDNSVPYSEYIKNSFNLQIHPIYKDKGYTVKSSLLSGYGHISDPNVFDNLQPTKPDKVLAQLNVVKLLEFSFLPYFMKKISGGYWDFEMLEAFKKYPFEVNNEKPLLLTFHLIGGHPPIDVDENFNFANSLTPFGKYRASLKMMDVFLKKMKKNKELYKNTTIIITSDHTGYVDKTTDQYIFTVIKPFGGLKGMPEIMTPLSSQEIKRILLDQDDGVLLSPEYFESIRNDKRFFIHYKWQEDSTDTDFFSQLRIVNINGSARNPKNYSFFSNDYDQDGKRILFGSTYSFPQDYNQLKDLFGPYWKKKDNEIVATNKQSYYNDISFRIIGEKIPQSACVVVKGYRMHTDGSKGKYETFSRNISSSYDFSYYFPDNFVIKELTTVDLDASLLKSKLSAKSTVAFSYLDSRKYFLKGWHETEGWGAWTSSTISKLMLPLDNSVKGISLNGIVFMAKDPYPLTISFNGVKVFSGELVSNNFLLNLDIPQEIQTQLHDGELLTIEFSMPHAIAPRALGKGVDARVLGIGLKSITTYERKSELDITEPIHATFMSSKDVDKFSFLFNKNWSKEPNGYLSALNTSRIVFGITGMKRDGYVAVQSIGCYKKADGTFSEDELRVDIISNPYQADISYQKNYLLKELKVLDYYTLLKEKPLNSRATITFDTPENAKFLTKNWSSPESWGTWSIESDAMLVLPVEKNVKGISLDAIVHLATKPYPLTILFNGEEVFSDEISQSNLSLNLDIPQNTLQKIQNGELLQIEFKMPNAKSPHELGLGEDIRKLGIGLKSITTYDNNVKIGSTKEIIISKM